MPRRKGSWTLVVAGLVVVSAAVPLAIRPGSAGAQDAEKPGPILEFRIVADRKRDMDASNGFLGEGLKAPPGYRWAKFSASPAAETAPSIVIDVPAEGDKPAFKALLIKIDRQNVTEADVERFGETKDDRGAPAIEFRLNPSGARRFGILTRENLPEEGGAAVHRLAILVDGQVVATPTIRSEIRGSGIISGLKPEDVAPLIDRLRKSAPDSRLREQAVRGFDDARFGLSIRWGLPAGEPADAAKRASMFKGEAFAPEAWVKAAKDSGAKFLVVTARGRDGFSLFESRRTSFDVVDATQFAKDPLGLLADACKKGAMPLYVTYATDGISKGGAETSRMQAGDLREQIRELCVGYGDLAGILFEGDAGEDSLGPAREILHETQPSASIGVDRVAPLDGEIRVVGLDPDRFESSYGASPTLLRLGINAPGGVRSSPSLVASIVESAGRGATLAIEVDASPDGSIPQPALDRLAEVGRWLGQFGDSVYSTRPGPVAPDSWGLSTKKGEIIYLHVLRPAAKISFPPISSPEIRSAGLFGGRKVEGFAFESGRPKEGPTVDPSILLPESARLPIDTIVILNPPEPKKPEAAKKKAATKDELIKKGE